MRSWRRSAPVATALDDVLAVDTSAVIAALFGGSPERLRERLVGAGELVAPHLIDVEFLHVTGRLALSGALSEDRAGDTRREFVDLEITRYSHEPLADAIWDLRHNLSAYDAAFVALASALGVPLITCDAKLASAAGDVVRIELFAQTHR
jgi:predicted nucleic acid-binding protein